MKKANSIRLPSPFVSPLSFSFCFELNERAVREREALLLDAYSSAVVASCHTPVGNDAAAAPKSFLKNTIPFSSLLQPSFENIFPLHNAVKKVSQNFS